ncbi:MAG: C2 family cysteine protease [Myxococcaceae bacterium]
MSSKIMREGSAYKAKLERTLKVDGKVTVAEADAIIKDAKAGKFSEVKAFYLSAFIDSGSQKFDPAARAKLAAFVQNDMHALAKIAVDNGREDLKTEPLLTKDSQKTGQVTWDARPGDVSVNGFGFDDPTQGQVGDCYFISALSAVAKSHPEILQNAVKANRDGTYTVTFYERNSPMDLAKPVQVTIDGKFADRHGMLEYAAARETKELWPMIFEKAYASWKGGFDAIEGGMSATALEAITGKQGDFFPVTSDMKGDALFAQIKAACANKGAVVALSKTWDPSEQGVVADHAYTLLGVEEKNGQKFVQLRNPWGEREPGRDGRDDGIFSLPIDKFATSFAAVEFVKP